MNARGGVHTPRSTLAGWGGQTGAQLVPLFDVHRHFVLGSRVVHADETPIAMLDPGAGKTKKGYMWAYARGGFDPDPGVVYDFCLGRGGKYPHEFLKGWSGTLVVDAYGGYDATMSLEGRITANCLAHSRRKFDELFKANASPVAAQAIQRIAMLYRIEADARTLTSEQRLQMRQERFLSRCGRSSTSGCSSSARVYPPARPSPRRSTTASRSGMGCPGSWSTATCRSTTTTSKTRCVPGPLDAKIGSS